MALQTIPMLIASLACFAPTSASIALSIYSNFLSRYLVSILLSTRHGSTYTINATPSFMAIAKGCAASMPPCRAVTFNVPFKDPPKCLSATAL